MLYGRFPETIDGVPTVDIPQCNPNDERNWMGWTKRELEHRGWSVTCPVIDRVWEAPYEDWKKVLERLDIDEETVSVGLSAGGAALARFLAEEKISIGKLDRIRSA